MFPLPLVLQGTIKFKLPAACLTDVESLCRCSDKSADGLSSLGASLLASSKVPDWLDKRATCLLTHQHDSLWIATNDKMREHAYLANVDK